MLRIVVLSFTSSSSLRGLGGAGKFFKVRRGFWVRETTGFKLDEV
jgi:hypothetical protein